MECRLVLTLALFALVPCLYFDTASAQRTGDLSAYKKSSFQNPESNAILNHILLHNQSGDVYVGAVNSFYRLDNNLEHQRNVSTASNECADERDCLNYNKVLFIEPLRNALITCGSYTGKCQLRHVEELTVSAEIVRIVASGEDKTTISILAPGPGNKDWLYVVATYTEGAIRSLVPPVSRRILDRSVPDERLLFADVDSQVNFDSDYKTNPFDINYVYGFSSKGFVYYVTHQDGISKVVRVCHQADKQESNLDAYTEITIQCGQGSNVYPSAQAAHVGPVGPGIAASLGIDSSDLMLYAVFTKNDNSTLCMFRMSDIESAFLTAVENCVRGTGGDSVSYLDGNQCITISVPDVTPYLCNRDALTYKYPNNPNALESTPLFERAGTMMSSILTTNELNHTVAFIGTSSGSLLKVHIVSGTSARHYESINLGDAPVLRDISLDDTKRHIYVLTEQQLLKLKVENCSQYTSCETCIGRDGDPYCGWCTLEKKCTRRVECMMADESNRWLPYNEIQCVAISNPYRSLPITEPQRPIVLAVVQLPKLLDGETYSCKFNDLPVYRGTTIENTVACNIPETSARPNIPSNEDHVEMRLSVVSSFSKMAFISTEFTFYQCSRHIQCGECVTSAWDCDWCVFDNTCTHQSTECTTGDTIVIGLNNIDGGPNQGPTFCPQLQPQEGKVLVPVDIPREIQVNVFNLPDSSNMPMIYECSLLIDNVKQSVPAAKVSNDVIQCNSRKYTYESNDVNEFVAQLSISWNGDRELDDYYRFNVTLYKCHADRRDCSRCLSAETARPELECRWCGNKICANIENTVCSNSALGPGAQCPAPHLEKVIPVSGPMEGNTVIAVLGTDIGQRFQDVQSVTVGQQPCDLTGLEDQYVTGQSVSCRIAPMSQDDTNSVTISVARVDNLQSTGKVDFTYTDPKIVNFHPRIGPAAGGTRINIIGVNMDTGNGIKAMIDTNVPCTIIRRNDTAILCTTAAFMAGNTGLLTVAFDGALRSSTDNFTYQPNPEVTDIQPRSSIKSGGRELTISGTDLTVSRAAIYVQHKDVDDNVMEYMFEESCQTQNDSTMVCTSPAIKLPDTMTPPCSDVTVGFQLDGFKILLGTIKFSYCLDPTFAPAEDPWYPDGNSLSIEGEMLDSATDMSEVWVTVGEENCTVMYLLNALLICMLPKERPSGLNNAMVRWYGNLTFPIGEVTFPADVLTLSTIIPSSVAIFIALILTAILGVMYFKQRKAVKGHHDRLLNRIRDFHEEVFKLTEGRRQSPLNTSPDNIVSRQQTIILNDRVNIVPEDVNIQFNQLEIGRLLGQGAFGKVYKAVLKHTPTGPHRTVTVKTVSDVDDPSTVIKFLEEGLIMKNFDHPNVLGLLGMTFDPEGQPLIVLPFMENGDLKSYLEKYKPGALTVLKFALDIAHGMEYLADRKFVHRDLAARNCLVDDKLIVKVGDFGLSRDLNVDDYYTSNDKQAKLPIKWMAPESMERRVYNTKTDMWSYGVVLWELFTGGRVPYPGIPNTEVYDYVKRGQRMETPKFCHKKIYEIMSSCWNESPKKRCSFQTVIKVLNVVMAIMTGNSSPLEEPGCTAEDAGYLIPLEIMKGHSSAKVGKSRGKGYINVETEMWK